jgi:hypothetical protein
MFLVPANKVARLLAYVTGLVYQKLLLQNEYLAAENRILRAQLPARMRLSDPERSILAEIGKRLGRTALQQVAWVAKPDTRKVKKLKLLEFTGGCRVSGQFVKVGLTARVVRRDKPAWSRE